MLWRSSSRICCSLGTTVSPFATALSRSSFEIADGEPRTPTRAVMIRAPAQVAPGLFAGRAGPRLGRVPPPAPRPHQRAAEHERPADAHGEHADGPGEQVAEADV